MHLQILSRIVLWSALVIQIHIASASPDSDFFYLHKIHSFFLLYFFYHTYCLQNLFDNMIFVSSTCAQFCPTNISKLSCKMFLLKLKNIFCFCQVWTIFVGFWFTMQQKSKWWSSIQLIQKSNLNSESFNVRIKNLILHGIYGQGKNKVKMHTALILWVLYNT